MPKAVFDTVVFVRALLNSHSPCGRLVFGYRSRYRLILSSLLAAEILEVLGREEMSRRLRLRALDYAGAMARLLKSMEQAEVVEPAEIPALSRDPKDDKVLATALAARADYLVSEDNDLLVLESYQGTAIVTCDRFLKVLSSSNGAGR